MGRNPAFERTRNLKKLSSVQHIDNPNEIFGIPRVRRWYEVIRIGGCTGFRGFRDVDAAQGYKALVIDLTQPKRSMI
jgi:hypothetical protein